MSSVAKRYASALMDVAKESNLLDEVGEDLHNLQRLLSDSDSFKHFVEHPLVSADQQKACISALLTNPSCPLTHNLFKLLIKRDRLSILPEIVRMGLFFWQEAKGIAIVNVVSASKLLAAQKTSLTKKLGERLGKEIELITGVDENLIGGFRIRIGDQVEDHSLATKLETFKRNVINA